MKEELLDQIDTTEAELLHIYASLSQEQLNQVPFKGSWTAGQVGEHLTKGCSVELLYGNTKPTERDPAIMIEPLRRLFLDFSTKMNSPDFIYPQENHYQKEEMYKRLETTWKNIRHAANTLDLNPTCMDFEFPGTGMLTRFEWLSFMVIHTQRHLHQLRNIYSKVAGQAYP